MTTRVSKCPLKDIPLAHREGMAHELRELAESLLAPVGDDLHLEYTVHQDPKDLDVGMVADFPLPSMDQERELTLRWDAEAEAGRRAGRRRRARRQELYRLGIVRRKK